MPYSFTQIEKDKSFTIGFVFSFLIIFYIFILAGLALLVKCFSLSFVSEKVILRVDVIQASDWCLIVLIGIVTTLVHYFISINHLSSRLLAWMKAKEPDPSIEKQKVFINILEEITTATGGMKFHGMIIPESSMNLFAVDDQQVTPVIGITEGALYRLTRPQLEAVIAHEAAHILKGDCSTATIVSAIFEFYTMPVKHLIRGRKKALSDGFDGDEVFSDGIRILFRLGPVALFFLAIITVFYFFTSVLAIMMRIFISREAKFRADAIAVRLTRDPVSLAQAIRLLSENWRGVGTEWENLEGIFFVNPYPSALDESEGFLSDLFSTHPSVQKRLNILLSMAKHSPENLEKTMQKQIREFKDSDKGFTGLAPLKVKWLLQRDHQWYGPFSLVEIGMINWINLDTPVKKEGDETIQLAKDVSYLQMIALNKSNSKKDLCPVCKIPLDKTNYEHNELKTCYSCQGTLVAEDQISIIMRRRELVLPKEAYNLAYRMNKQEVDQHISWVKITESQNQNGFICPTCTGRMQTRLFNSFYPVPIDKCLTCGCLWFEQGELDLIQALYELKDPTSRG